MTEPKNKQSQEGFSAFASQRRLAVLEEVQATAGPDAFTLWVDGTTGVPVADQTGAFAAPFSTIQAAIDEVPVATDAASSRCLHHIRIAQGTYDEDLTVDITGRRILLAALATWNLGLFDSATWQPSGTRRNITITGDSSTIDNIRTYFGILNFIEGGNRGGSVSSSFTAPRISGQLTSDIAGPNDSIEMDIEAEIYGTNGGESGVSIDFSSDTDVNLNLIRSHLRGQIVGGSTAADSNLLLSRLYQTRLRGDVTADNVSLVRECDCEENWTINAASGGGSAVLGFLDTIFEGEMDCDNSAFLMKVDAYTQARMMAQGGTVVNGFKEFRYTTETTAFAGGASAPSAGEHLEAQAGVGGTSTTLGVSTEAVIPHAGNLVRLAWNSASADATTVMKVVVASVVVATVTLTGASGSLDLSALAVSPVQPQVAAGAKIAVEYDTGTAPGNITAQVYMQ